MVRVLFLHPDLGIGGAERLVVDAALALKQYGHKVSFLTNHHDASRCFEETRNGTLPVQVVGDWLPRTIGGRFYAFCAYVRMLYMAFYAALNFLRKEQVDIVFCDLISIGIPVLRLARPQPKIIYYCHHPDQLLYERHDSWLQRIYRAPINYIEEYTTGMADKTLVNSKYTLRVFRETFRRLRLVPDVLYPSLHTHYFDKMQQEMLAQTDVVLPENLHDKLPNNAFIFLDINRYERKKNHALALEAMHELSKMISSHDFKRISLIIVGGYDDRLPENVQHYEELKQLTENLMLERNVHLLRSPKDQEKLALLHAAHCLIYTPSNEHFGIVPLEAMYMSKPVIAVNSGGPMETVVHQSTGFLCEPQALSFAKAMCQFFRDKTLSERMGSMGYKRVQQKFSFESFSHRLDSIIKELLDGKKIN